MEARPILSSSFATGNLLPPPHLRLHNPIQRGLSSIFLNPRQREISVRRKNPVFCVEAGAPKGNVATATRIPTSVPVRVAIELLQAGHRFLDVRTYEEFIAGHAAGAINVPYMFKVGSGMIKNPNFLKEVKSHFGKYDEIIVGCQSGKRSIMAATDLLASGFTVIDIAGGFGAWKQSGLPTE